MIQVDQSVKGRLEQEVRRVRLFIETLRSGGRSEEMESGGDNTPLSEAADAAQIVEERELGTHLLGWLADRAAELDRALLRIEEGTYGVCARCEGPIHPQRLQALPEAPFCQECQRTTESELDAHSPGRGGAVRDLHLP